MPQGWHVLLTDGSLHQHLDPTYHNRVLYIQFKCNLHGCKQVAHNLFKHLTPGLIQTGFRQSTNDTCLFLYHDCILIINTNDCIIFSKEDSIIDTLLQHLSTFFILEDQGSIQVYLGMQITKDTVTKRIFMTQPGLIQSLLQDLNLLQDVKTKITSSVSILYYKWHYRSVIGQLCINAHVTRLLLLLFMSLM
jgi:hypothetical protein